MLRNAARVWGYSETEPETQFDPLISLLLTVNAAEFERLAGEISSSRARVLERMVQLMAPEVLTGALPAHAVMQAASNDAQGEINASDQFYINIKDNTSSGETMKHRDVYFTPAGRYTVNQALVKFTYVNNKIYKHGDINGRELFADVNHSNSPQNCMYLGLQLPDKPAGDTSFYFDIRNVLNTSLFTYELPKAKWTVADIPLQTRPGCINHETAKETQPGSTRIMPQVLQRVREHYDPFFVTLNMLETGVGKNSANARPGWVTAMPDKERQALEKEQLCWVKISFPESISNAMLEDVLVYANCFPVLNRQLHNVAYRLQDHINIVQLASDDAYLDTESIATQAGKQLYQQEQAAAETGPGILVRSGGVGRFDERDAAAWLDHLSHLLRDETAAFARVGKDFVANEVKQLQQILNRLDQQLAKNASQAKHTPYVLVKRNDIKQTDHIYVDYWSTAGAGANSIKAGTPLAPYRTGAVQHNKAFLITGTTGGRNALSQTASTDAYKAALLSKNRVMSIEDIKLFCKMNLGEKVQQVLVQKGIMTGTGSERGYVRTIDVKIAIGKNEWTGFQEGEQEYWHAQLPSMLMEKSMALMPFRVFFEAAA